MVRFERQEYDRLTQLAANEGLSVATYIRRAALLFMRRNHDLVDTLVRKEGTTCD